MPTNYTITIADPIQDGEDFIARVIADSEQFRLCEIPPPVVDGVENQAPTYVLETLNTAPDSVGVAQELWEVAATQTSTTSTGNVGFLQALKALCVGSTVVLSAVPDPDNPGTQKWVTGVQAPE